MFLTNTFFNDMTKQKCCAESERSFDAHTFYDRSLLNYGIMSWQAFGVPLCVEICMLMAIQLIDVSCELHMGTQSPHMVGEERRRTHSKAFAKAMDLVLWAGWA